MVEGGARMGAWSITMRESDYGLDLFSERHIKQALVTGETLSILLEKVRRVQDPGHEMYQSWIREEARQEWIAHIRALQEILEAHR